MTTRADAALSDVPVRIGRADFFQLTRRRKFFSRDQIGLTLKSQTAIRSAARRMAA